MNEKFLNILIKECKKAFKKDEVPIACIITKNSKIISKSHNLKHKTNFILNHAYLLYIDTLQKARNIIPSYQAVTEDNVKCLQSGFLADKSVDIGHKKE